MAQQTRLQIVLAAERIDDFTGGGFGHGVDGQIAARQILLQRDLGGGVKGKAGIAGRGFALGARQRVFLVRLRMQEHGKVLADRTKARVKQRLGGGADDDPVTIFDGQTKQAIAHAAANPPDFKMFSRVHY